MNPKSVTIKFVAIALVALIFGFAGAAIHDGLMPIGSPSNAKVGLGANLWLVTMNYTNNLASSRSFNTSYLNSGNDGNVMVLQVEVGLQNANASIWINTLNLTQVDNRSLDIRAATAVSFYASGNSDFHVYQLTAFIPWRYWYEVNNTVEPRTGGTPIAAVVGWFESVPPTGFGQMIAPEIMSIRRL
jgi:hypothetical protein